ncbi:MAG: AMP-binding protein [candidate division WOR-3 bacterium]
MEKVTNLWDLLEASAEVFSDSVALQAKKGGRWHRFTYKDLLSASRALASHLRNMGVRPGDRVGLLSENSPYWGMTFFGSIGTGAIVVPVDAGLKPQEMKFVLSDAGVSHLICSERFLSSAGDLGIRDIIIAEEIPSLPLANGFAAHRSGLGDLAAIYYTSGTMGTQKGVMLSHGNLLADLEAAFQRVPYEPGTAFLSVLPLSHVFELTVGFLGPLRNGGTITYPENLTSFAIVDAMSETGTQIMAVVPMLLKLFHNGIQKKIKAMPGFRRLVFGLLLGLSRLGNRFGFNLGRRFFPELQKSFGGRLRFFISGGAALDPALERNFWAMGLPVLVGYGLSEASPVVSVNTMEERAPGSVGKPLPCCEVKLADDGEILVRGENVFLGYNNNPSATADVLHDGWLHTGDIGRFDRRGFLYIKGRKKNVIVTAGGLKVFPEELEEALSRSELIKEVCVLGIPSGQGEAVHAVIYPNQDSIREISEDDAKRLVANEIMRCLSGLADYKRLDSWEFWPEELPKTPTRKVKRKVLFDMIISKMSHRPTERETYGQKAPDLSGDPDAERIREILAEMVGLSPADISWGASLARDLGMDSLMKVELLAALDKEMGLSIPVEYSYQINTLAQLVEMAVRYKGISGGLELLLDDQGYGDISEIYRTNAFYDMTRFSIYLLLHHFVRAYFRLRVHNQHMVPRTGSFIVATNHTSLMDFPVVLTSLPWSRIKDVVAPAAKDFFFEKTLRKILVQIAFRAFPLERFGNFLEGLRATARMIKEGYSVILFPEGMRSKDGRLGDFKPGVGALSYELGVPVLPAYIRGAHRAFPKGSAFPKPVRVDVIFGEPVWPNDFARLDAPSKYSIYTKIAGEIRERIAKLMERYP